ncbi:Crp/Fnr family transcriptional regulator [Chloroflexota bacterium]
MTVEIEPLKSIPYFADLNSEELGAIMLHVFEKSVDRGEIILLDEEPPKAIYFVISGAVKAFKTSAEGKEQILCIIRPGESFNDVPIFDGGPNPASVQAMGPATLYGIRRNDLETILREHPQVSLNANKVLAGRVRHLVSLVEDLSFRHVIGRVAKILLDYASDGTGPRPRLTQQEMAAVAGTAREVVGRSLKALEGEGAIRLDRNRIIIADRKILKEMVEASS